MNTLLSINNYFYVRGGAEVVFLEHNKMFENENWSVVPFSMRHSKNQPTEWGSYFVEEIEFGNSYSITDKLRLAPKFLYSFEAQRNLSRLIEKTSPDIAHSHNIYHHLSPSVLHTLKKHNVPNVITLHDLKIACPEYHMLSPAGICEACKGGKHFNVVRNKCIKGSSMYSALVWAEAKIHSWLNSYENCVDKFVVPSKFYLEKLVEWGYQREQFVYVPNFVNADKFEPRYDAGDYYLYIGRLSEEKGVATLIKAAASAGVKLKIAGTGDLEEKLRNDVEVCGADAEFLGYVSGSDLHEAIKNCRAVVLPSEWYENAPLSVMEAYALGKPVIGASIGGIPEMVDDGETGAHFTSGNSEELAQVLGRFAGMSSVEISALGKAGRAKVEAEFSPGRYKESMKSLYASINGASV